MQKKQTNKKIEAFMKNIGKNDMPNIIATLKAISKFALSPGNSEDKCIMNKYIKLFF